MTGCDAYGDLLGGYVLGALDAEEVEAVRRHLETCPACAREHAALADLPALLDRVEPADVPPPAPPPALEEAVLDNWARERRQSRTTGGTRRAADERVERAPEPDAAPGAAHAGGRAGSSPVAGARWPR